MDKVDKDQINILVRLQTIEIESRRIEAQIGAVSQRYEHLDRRLSAFETAIDEEEERIETLQKKYRSDDAELQTSLSLISKSKEKSRSVKTNKEYQSFLKEIEDLQAKISQAEDEMLECLEQIEGGEALVISKKEEYGQFLDEVSREKEKISAEADEWEQKLVQFESDRIEVSAKADPKILSQFHKVKESLGGGLTIVPVNNAVCQGCNVNIPPQMYNELQRLDRLRFCPNCQRIIYWRNVNKEK
jgi:hypothetical protein